MKPKLLSKRQRTSPASGTHNPYLDFVSRCEAITPKWQAVRDQFHSDREFLALLPYSVKDPYSPAFRGNWFAAALTMFRNRIAAIRSTNDPGGIAYGRLSHSLRLRAMAIRRDEEAGHSAGVIPSNREHKRNKSLDSSILLSFHRSI